MNYNKIIYLLKNVKITTNWINKIDNIFQYIQQIITLHINNTATLKYQLPLSQKKGGLGLRNPSIFYPATKISALCGKSDILKNYFNFNVSNERELYNNQQNNINNRTENNNNIKKKLTTTLYDTYYKLAETKRSHELHKMINIFNEFINPEFHFDEYSYQTHRQLLEIIDKKLLCEYYNVATLQDKSRIKALSINGATSWLTIPPNNIYGMEFSNMEYYILLSLYLGAPLTNKPTICKRCNTEQDIYGHHSLSCKFGKFNIQRHNNIRNQLKKFLDAANYNTKIEMNYNYQNQPDQINVHNNQQPSNDTSNNMENTTINVINDIDAKINDEMDSKMMEIDQETLQKKETPLL
jgi:hypothetical protein